MEIQTYGKKSFVMKQIEALRRVFTKRKGYRLVGCSFSPQGLKSMRGVML